MYCYIYDHFLSEEKYFRLISSIETILTDLGIHGRIIRLNVLNNNPQQLIKDEIKRGAKNLIVVGNDKLICQVIDTVAHYPEITLGIIPMGTPTEIAKNFGIPHGEEACTVLANRLIRHVSLAKINNCYFLYQAEILNPEVTLTCDDLYRVEPEAAYSIKINNLPTESGEILQTTIQPKSQGLLIKRHIPASVFNSHRVIIESKNQRKPSKIIADEEKELTAPAVVEITNLKLRVIVGRGLFV